MRPKLLERPVFRPSLNSHERLPVLAPRRAGCTDMHSDGAGSPGLHCREDAYLSRFTGSRRVHALVKPVKCAPADHGQVFSARGMAMGRSAVPTKVRPAHTGPVRRDSPCARSKAVSGDVSLRSRALLNRAMHSDTRSIYGARPLSG